MLLTYRHLDLHTNAALSPGPTFAFVSSPTLPESSRIRLELGPTDKPRTPRMAPNELRPAFPYRHRPIRLLPHHLVRRRTHTHRIRRPRNVAVSLGRAYPPAFRLPEPQDHLHLVPLLLPHIHLRLDHLRRLHPRRCCHLPATTQRVAASLRQRLLLDVSSPVLGA